MQELQKSIAVGDILCPGIAPPEYTPETHLGSALHREMLAVLESDSSSRS
jgi:hypothetical protein